MIGITTLLTCATLSCPIIGHGLKRYYVKRIRYIGRSTVTTIRKSDTVTSYNVVYTPYGIIPVMTNNITKGQWNIRRMDSDVEYQVIDYNGNIGYVEHVYISDDLGADSLENIHKIITLNTLYVYYSTALLLILILILIYIFIIYNTNV